MLDLVRLSRRPLFPPGGQDLCRQIALLTDLREGQELLVVPGGLAVTLEFFVREWNVAGSGVEPDAVMVERAEERLRTDGLLDRVHLQTGSPDQLPFRDEIFDVVVGELGLTSGVDPATAVRELIRVTRPGGAVVLVQPSWKAPVEEERRAVLSEHLGARPLMLVEWKRLMIEGGLEQLHTEDWSDEATAFRPQVSKPFPDFAELFSLREKLGVLRRAWGRWGWRGVWTVLTREHEVHRLFTRERILGLDLVKGVKPAATMESVAAETRAAEAAGGIPPTEGSVDEAPVSDESAQDDPTEESDVEDLPLFHDAPGT